MAQAQLATIRQATRDYLDSIKGTTPAPADVEMGVLALTKNYFDLYNAAAAKNAKWKIPGKLLPIQVAQIMVTLHPIVAIETAGDKSDMDYTLVAMYQENGDDEGIYVVSDELFSDLANEYCYGMNKREYEDLMWHIRRMAPKVQPCREPNLIAVNNGIFDYDTKTLLPFSQD